MDTETPSRLSDVINYLVDETGNPEFQVALVVREAAHDYNIGGMRNLTEHDVLILEREYRAWVENRVPSAGTSDDRIADGAAANAAWGRG